MHSLLPSSGNFQNCFSGKVAGLLASQTQCCMLTDKPAQVTMGQESHPEEILQYSVFTVTECSSGQDSS